tara:strand:- start:307 stop:633 length:327 start_codon:yes stop_codon:yes gene_type:complete
MRKVKDMDTKESREQEMMDVRWADKGIISMLNQEAIEVKRNRSVTPELINILSDGIKYPVTMEFIHNDDEMRVQFYGPKAGKFWLDMSIDNYNSLPVIKVSDTTPTPV